MEAHLENLLIGMFVGLCLLIPMALIVRPADCRSWLAGHGGVAISGFSCFFSTVSKVIARCFRELIFLLRIVFDLICVIIPVVCQLFVGLIAVVAIFIILSDD